MLERNMALMELRCPTEMIAPDSLNEEVRIVRRLLESRFSRLDRLLSPLQCIRSRSKFVVGEK